MATFVHGNTIVGMLNSINDLVSDYSNGIDYLEMIGAKFDEFITGTDDNDRIIVISSIDNVDQYMRFVEITDEITDGITEFVSDDDDVNDVISAINSIINILQ